MQEKLFGGERGKRGRAGHACSYKEGEAFPSILLYDLTSHYPIGSSFSPRSATKEPAAVDRDRDPLWTRHAACVPLLFLLRSKWSTLDSSNSAVSHFSCRPPAWSTRGHVRRCRGFLPLSRDVRCGKLWMTSGASVRVGFLNLDPDASLEYGRQVIIQCSFHFIALY